MGTYLLQRKINPHQLFRLVQVPSLLRRYLLACVRRTYFEVSIYEKKKVIESPLERVPTSLWMVTVRKSDMCRSIFKVIKKGLTLVEARELADSNSDYTIRTK